MWALCTVSSLGVQVRISGLLPVSLQLPRAGLGTSAWECQLHPRSWTQPRLPCPVPALGRALLPVTSRAQSLHWLPWTYITCPQGTEGKACWYHAKELCSRVAPSSGGCPWTEVHPGVPAVQQERTGSPPVGRAPSDSHEQLHQALDIRLLLAAPERVQEPLYLPLLCFLLL